MTSPRGLIPAHAGKTPCRGEQRHERGAHPRSRGENVVLQEVPEADQGSSPLTRGKPKPRRRRRSRQRLIPAHAGKTSTIWATPSQTAAHPRSRGENLGLGHDQRFPSGSSPLTRGKPFLDLLADGDGGLIPAHAGKTEHKQPPKQPRGAHPRSRGENLVCWFVCVCTSGSSPLTRGKPNQALGTQPNQGLIPAHAGKTKGIGHEIGDLRAHPRSRGEND